MSRMQGRVLMSLLGLALLVAVPTPSTAAPAATAKAAGVHKVNSLKWLRTSPGTWRPAAVGPTSPYARAAALRDDSGMPPAGHAHVAPRATATATSAEFRP